MADERLRLEARFNDLASAGVKRLGRNLENVKPSTGMAAATKWMTNFRAEAEKVGVAVRPVASGLNALGVGGLAASLSMGEIVKQVRSLSDSTLNLRELSRQSRISMDDLRQLKYAAGKMHMDPKQIDGALAGWSDKMLDLRRGMGDFYQELIFNNKDVAEKIKADSPIDALKDTLDFLSRIKDPAVQRRWAESMNLGEFVPMLGKGPQGLAAAFAEAGREVKPLTQAMVDAADKLNESTNRFSQKWEDLMNDVGPKLIDPLTGVVDKLDAVFKEGGKIFGSAPEPVPPRKPDGSAGESTGEMLVRTGRNTLRTFFSSDNELAKEGQALWDQMFGAGEAKAGEMPLPASAKWAHPDEDRLTRARSSDLRVDVKEGARAGIVQGLRELAQQQELDGKGPGGSGVDGKGGVGAPSLRYGRDPVSGAFRRGGRSGGGRGYADTPDGSGDAGAVKGGMGQRAMAAMKYLVENKGYTPEGAAIAVGNAMRESSVTGTASGDPSVPGGSHHMFQWNRGRLAAFRAYAAARGKDVNDFNTNLDFFDEERKQRSGLEAEWHKQTDLHNAGRLGHLFEGYGDSSEGVRVQNARNMLDAWRRAHSGAGTPAPSAAAIGDAAVQAARMRLLNGGRDPADRALVKRYLEQQNAPQRHAAGGWIRGPGGPREDRVLARLSPGEFVVNARSSGKWADLLHAINGDRLPAFADGGEVEAGLARHRSWRSFFRRPRSQGGMGAPDHVALGAMAMMMGESGRWLNPRIFNPNDVDGPSGGSAQWHDVTRGRWRGRIHRLSDLMRFAMLQHADWRDVPIQQAWFKRETDGEMAGAWAAMRRARTAAGALSAGVHRYEIPANANLEVLRRMPNITRLAREGAAGGGGTVQHDFGPVEVDIRHHPHTGRPMIQARAGKGTSLKLRTMPMMRPT